MTDIGTGDSVGESRSRIGRKVKRGLAWSGGIAIVERGWMFLLGVIIARWLAPAEYAAFAASLTVVLVLVAIDDFGVLATLVNAPGRFKDVAPTGGLVSLVLGVLLYVGLFLSSPWLAQALGLEGYGNVLRIMGVGLLCDSLAIVPNAFIMRDLRPRRRGVVTAGRLIVRTVVMVIVATQARDAVGMAVSLAAGEVAALVTSYAIVRTLPRYGFNAEAFKRISRFGFPLALAGLLALGTFTIDNFIVGGRLGGDALGFYLVAFNVATWPVNIIGGAMVPVVNPAFAEYTRHEHELGPLISRSMVWLIEVACPVTALIIGLARPLVVGVFGERWTPSINVVTAIAALGVARLVFNLGQGALAAQHRSFVLAGLQSFWLALVCVLVTVGAEVGGITGAAWGHVVAASIVVAVMFLLLRRVFAVPLGNLRAAIRPVVGSVLIGVLAWGVADLLERVGVPELVQVLIASVIGLAVFLVVGLSVSRRQELVELTGLRRRIRWHRVSVPEA